MSLVTTINTADYEGFNDVHKERLNENDRDVTGKCIYISDIYYGYPRTF